MAQKSRSERLTQRPQFEAVLASHNTAMGRRFVVRAKENGVMHARLGIIAARKAIPRAVDRNRCKRLVREVFRAAQPMLAALDVVVLCRRAVARSEQAAGREELAELFATVGGCCGERSAARKR